MLAEKITFLIFLEVRVNQKDPSSHHLIDMTSRRLANS